MNKNNVFIPYEYRWYRLDKHIVNLCKSIKWMFQRAAKGYCDMDVWSIDEYLVHVIPDMLDEMAKVSQGYPASFDDSDAPFSEEIHKQWLDYLTNTAKLFRAVSMDAVDDQIELAFEQYLKDKDEDKWRAAQAEISRKRKILNRKAFDELLKHFNELWW